jgi:hypothetical protein
MKTQTHPDVLHYQAAHPCCESTAAADLFPDLLQLGANKHNRGRVASIYVESVGVGTQGWQLTIDEAAWKDCITHPNFRACYDLSMAKLALQKAILGH